MKDIKDEVVLQHIEYNLYDFIKNHTPYKDTDEVFSYAGITYDYKRFRDLVEKLIRILSSIPYLKPGDKVVIGMVTCPESIALVYACNYVSLTPLMVDVRLSPMEYKNIITEAGSKLAFLADISSRNLKLICEAPCLKDLYIVSPIQSAIFLKRFFWGVVTFSMGFRYFFTSIHKEKVSYWKKFLARDPGENAAPEFTKGTADTEIIFATSGSTGDRKFVIQTPRALNLNIYYNEYYFDFHSPEYKTSLTFLPVFALAGFASSIHFPLYYGKKVYIHQIYDFRKITDAIIEFKPNMIIGSVGMWEHFLHSESIKGQDLSFLKFCLYSGEKCEPERIENMDRIMEEHGCKTKLMQVYGMTELTVIAMHTPETYNINSAGKPFPMVDVCIVKEGTHEELPAGEAGEICVHSIGMMKGYWQNEEATARMLQVHPDGKTYLHTGDLGYMDSEGYLYINGRIKNMHVSISGTKIFTPDLEAEVQRMDGVVRSAAVVCKVPERNDITGIILFVELTKDSPLNKNTDKKIKAHCHDNLPMFLRPDKVIALDTMPMTSTGKIDYQDLQKQADSYMLKHKPTKINVK